MYKELEGVGPLTEELRWAIRQLLEYINGDGSKLSEDCYRSQVLFWLRDALERRAITREEYDRLHAWYVDGGLYGGQYPWAVQT